MENNNLSMAMSICNSRHQKDQVPQQCQQHSSATTSFSSAVSSSPLPSQNATQTVLLESKMQNAMVSPVLFKLQKLSKTPISSQKDGGVENGCPEVAFSATEKQKGSFPAGRYNSPTDSLISPISKGLLIKSRRAIRASYTLVPPKVLDKTYAQDDASNGNKSSC